MKSNFIKESTFEYNGITFELSSINTWGEDKSKAVNELYAWSEETEAELFFEIVENNQSTIYWICEDELIDIIKNCDIIDLGSVREEIIRCRETEAENIRMNGVDAFNNERKDFYLWK